MIVHGIAPFVLLVAVAGVVILAATGHWGVQPERPFKPVTPPVPKRSQREGA
jgi:hypothetical protein